MASNYTSNPTATEPPAPTPAANALPIVSIPAGTDALSIESITQWAKMNADYLGWLMQVIGGTRSAKSLTVDGTGGATVTTVDGTTVVSAALGAAGVSSAVARGTTSADMVPVAWGRAVCDVGPSFQASLNCTAISRTGAGVYKITLGVAVPSVTHAMVVATVVTDGTTASVTAGFVDTSNIALSVFDAAHAAHDGGVIGFVVYSLMA